MGLIKIQQLRDEGVDETSVDDPRAQAAIDQWSQFVEQHCRQPFTPKPRTVAFDGNNSDTLFLPWPLIALKSLYINGDFANPLTAADYRAYMGLDFPDDRKNPKVRLVNTLAGSPASNFFMHRHRRPFVRGKQNQRITGVFGYCDASEPIDIVGATNASPIVVATAEAHGLADGDWVRIDDVQVNSAANYAWKVTVIDDTHASLNGSAGNGAFTAGGTLRKLSVPALIQRAVLKLVVAKTPQIASSDEAATVGPVAFEMTDGHSIQYIAPDRFKVRAVTIGITKDPEVEQILAMFRAPAKMRAPGTLLEGEQ